MSGRIWGLRLSVLLVTAFVAAACGGSAPMQVPPQVSQYRGPVKDAVWAKQTVELVTNGIKDDQTKLIVLNRTIAARIEHLSEHPGNLSDQALWDLGNGWCDNVSRLFVTLAKAAGYPARVVALTHTDGVNLHVVAEAYYKGNWHLFDPDHGVEYYRGDGRVASFEDLQRNRAPVVATKDPWKSLNGVGMEGFYQVPMTAQAW